MTQEIVVLNQSSDDSALWAEAINRWLESVERRRGSARSRHEYQKNLKAFFEFLERKHPALITGADCQRWVSSMEQAGLAKTTINSRVAAVSSFYQFCCAKFEARPGQFLHSFNPAGTVSRYHINPYEKSQGLTIEQARQLLAACDRTGVKGARDFAILSFYIFTGRRRAEVARLLWRDLRPGSGPGEMEYHYTGKGGKTGWRELPAPVWAAIKTYLEKSDRWNSMKAESPLFVSIRDDRDNTDRPIADITVTRIVEDAARKAGLGHVKVHALRHTAAKLRRKAGDSLEEVSKFLDHSNVATTQIYLGALEAKKDEGWKKVQDLLGL